MDIKIRQGVASDVAQTAPLILSAAESLLTCIFDESRIRFRGFQGSRCTMIHGFFEVDRWVGVKVARVSLNVHACWLRE